MVFGPLDGAADRTDSVDPGNEAGGDRSGSAGWPDDPPRHGFPIATTTKRASAVGTMCGPRCRPNGRAAAVYSFLVTSAPSCASISARRAAELVRSPRDM